MSLHRILLQAGSINIMGFEAVIVIGFVSLAVAGIKFSKAPQGDWRILSSVLHTCGLGASQHAGHGHTVIPGTFFPEAQVWHLSLQD